MNWTLYSGSLGASEPRAIDTRGATVWTSVIAMPPVGVSSYRLSTNATGWYGAFASGAAAPAAGSPAVDWTRISVGLPSTTTAAPSVGGTLVRTTRSSFSSAKLTTSRRLATFTAGNC